jgi:hypothetical protein
VSSPVSSAPLLSSLQLALSLLSLLCLHQCPLLPCSLSQPTSYPSDCSIRTRRPTSISHQPLSVCSRLSRNCRCSSETAKKTQFVWCGFTGSCLATAVVSSVSRSLHSSRCRCRYINYELESNIGLLGNDLLRRDDVPTATLTRYLHEGTGIRGRRTLGYPVSRWGFGPVA